MNDQNKTTTQKLMEETRIHVPEGVYNILELYKIIDQLHLRMGQQSLKDITYD